MAEPQRVQSAVTATSSASLTNSSKVSMFKAKTGFVIPKNKLSGSLVPTFRGAKKSEVSDAADGESNKQMQRKTRWAPDLSQDAAVRRGRALAYQTRVEQITQQLKSGSLGNGDDQRSRSVETASDHELSSQLTDSQEKLQYLELEKQEAIGEILKLNPTYKAPPDYEPLIREATVPLPVKEHPGYNFVGLVFGPGSDTQKRLEKETGARIQVYGTKSETGQKVEVTADENEVLNLYDELCVQISADSYEKVDAAVVLIELLVASVSGKSSVSMASASASGNDMLVLSKAQDTAIAPPTSVAVQSQELPETVLGPMLTAPGGFQPYPAPWLLTGQTHGRSGLLPVPNTSMPVATNPVFSSSFPFNSSSMSSFGHGPASTTGFASAPLTSPNVPPSLQPPMQVFQRPFIPPPHPSGHMSSLRSPHVSIPQSLPAQPDNSTPSVFTGHHPMAVGPQRALRPLTPSLPPPMPNIPSGRPPVGQLTPLGSSTTGWNGPPLGASQSLGPGGTVQMPQPLVSSQRPLTAPSQPIAPSKPSASAQPISGASIPPLQVVFSSASSMIPRPLHGPLFLPQNRCSSAMPLQLLAQQGPLLNSSPNNPMGSTPVPSSAPTTPRPLQSGLPSPIPGSIPIPSFTPLSSMAGAAPRPQQPSSGDFTFQPQRPPAPPQISQSVPSVSNRSASQSGLPSEMQPPVPQAPTFPRALQNTAAQPGQSPLRPQLGNQMGQHPAVPPVSFGGNLGNYGPSFMNPQMGPRNVGPVAQSPNLVDPFLSRPRTSNHVQQNYPVSPLARPGNSYPTDQDFSASGSFATVKPVASPGGQQIYDPFSPTSVSVPPQQHGSNLANAGKQDNDPEYEDLMASVGVK